MDEQINKQEIIDLGTIIEKLETILNNLNEVIDERISS